MDVGCRTRHHVGVATQDDRWTLLIVPRTGDAERLLARHDLVGLTEKEVRSMFGLRRARVPEFLPIPVDREHLGMLQPYAMTSLVMNPDATGELWRGAVEGPVDVDVDAANAHEVRGAAKACIGYVAVAALLWLAQGVLDSGMAAHGDWHPGLGDHRRRAVVHGSLGIDGVARQDTTTPARRPALTLIERPHKSGGGPREPDWSAHIEEVSRSWADQFERPVALAGPTGLGSASSDAPELRRGAPARGGRSTWRSARSVGGAEVEAAGTQ